MTKPITRRAAFAMAPALMTGIGIAATPGSQDAKLAAYCEDWWRILTAAEASNSPEDRFELEMKRTFAIERAVAAIPAGSLEGVALKILLLDAFLEEEAYGKNEYDLVLSPARDAYRLLRRRGGVMRAFAAGAPRWATLDEPA